MQVNAHRPARYGGALLAITMAFLSNTAQAAQAYKIVDLGAIPNFSMDNTNSNSSVSAINNAGEVLGGRFNYGFSANVVWQDGASRSVGPWAAINDLGDVVGFDRSRGSTTTSAVYQRKTESTVRFLASLGEYHEGRSSSAASINNVGQIVGYATTDQQFLGPVPHAVMWESGRNGPVLLPTLGGSDELSSSALDINDAGQVVGYSQMEFLGGGVPTLWTNGVATRIEGLAGVTAINNAGQVLGYTGSDVLIWDQGSITKVASDWDELFGFNESGQVVGSLNGVATLWDDGEVINLDALLNKPGWVLHQAKGINDQGWIAATAYKPSVTEDFPFELAYNAYVLIPVPEPDSLVLVLAGAGVLGFTWRARRRTAAQA